MRLRMSSEVSVGPAVIEPDAVGPRDAGDFGPWFAAITDALDGDGVSDVPCGECTACCCAAQFIEVGPDETATLAAIPRSLLFPGPGAPVGTLVMGYDELGRCPMFLDGACSIYAQRPRACRVYDCRVFAASEVYPDEPEKSAVTAPARRWVFTYRGESDRRQHEAVRAQARSLRAQVERSAQSSTPPSTTEVAIRAISDVAVAGS